MANGCEGQTEPDVPPGYPRFSWDRVPVFIHFGKNDGLTEEELRFVAAHTDFVCLEKGHGYLKYGSTEKGIEADAAALKRLNPEIRVLFYWNAFLDYSMYEAHHVYNSHPEWWLRTLDGDLDVIRTNLKRYDFTNPEMRIWYAAVAGAATEKSSDGIYMDAFPQVGAPANIDLWGEEKYREMQEGLHALIRDVRETMGEGNLIVFNGIRNVPGYSFGMDFVPVTDAAKIEHFGHFRSESKESMLRDMEAMMEAGRQGKIVIMKGWPGFDWLRPHVGQTAYEELLAEARKNITFPLACFLVAARPFSYFCYSWGYREQHGSLDWYPEFDKPLGEPKADAVRNGWEFTREFEHCRVWVNLETREAEIEWKN